MSKIKKQEAKDLSLDFDGAATAVGLFLTANYATLKAAEIERLRSLRWTLFDLAEEMTQRAIGVNLANLEGGLPTIRQATARATKSVAKIKAVGTVVAIVSEVINLALSVSTGNVEGVAKSVAEIVKLSQEKKPDKPKEG